MFTALDTALTRAGHRRRADRMEEAFRSGVCFLQHDFDIADDDGASVRADLNNAIEALATNSSGATTPSTTYAYQTWYDTTAGVKKRRNAANSAWLIEGTIDEAFVVSRSSNTILDNSDYGKTFVATSSFTQTLTAAATLTDGWWCRYRNNGTGVITLDPNSTETVQGLTTVTLQPGDDVIIVCDGSAFYMHGWSRFMGDNENANNTAGVTVNQGGNDDEIATYKSNDIMHGYTALTETDSFGVLRKYNATTGGLKVQGFRGATGTIGISVEGYAATAVTTAATNTAAYSMVYGYECTGTGKTDATANALIFGVDSQVGGSDRALFFIDEDGDLFVDGSTTPTAFDAWDDAALVRAFDRELSPSEVIDTEFDRHVQYRRADLVRAGIITDPRDGGEGMVNITRLQRLHNGAIWQLHVAQRELAEKVVAELVARVSRVEQKLLVA